MVSDLSGGVLHLLLRRLLDMVKTVRSRALMLTLELLSYTPPEAPSPAGNAAGDALNMGGVGHLADRARHITIIKQVRGPHWHSYASVNIHLRTEEL
jgi:hypothetical protein